MLRIVENSTAAGAKSYYSTADYYTEGQELSGLWKGMGAVRLGLAGAIEKDDWDALCDNRDPNTGTTLTARQKANRRIGYDFNFHVPKGVSLLYGLTEDPRILEAFRDAVCDTMNDMEAEMQARVRKKGRNEDRTTGNMVWGEFVHTTARPVDGVPDPHLHAHAFVFNTTFDGEEGRWKAGQFAGLKRDGRYFEAAFHSRLARGMAELGLPVVRTRKGWELAGLAASTLRKFSRRTREIEERAQAEGISDPEELGALGARTRKGKAKNLSMRQLQEEWRERLTTEESDALRLLAERIGSDPIPCGREAGEAAVKWAVNHVFERSSVVGERELAEAALRHGLGEVLPQDVRKALAAEPLLRATRDGRTCVTTKEVLAEERALVDFARKGRGAHAPFAKGPHRFARDWLGADQRLAVEQILGSRDRVTLLRGGAGTGKTSLMQETVSAIEAGGKKVFTFAPSADASHGVLRSEGFADADTVARLLVDERMQQAARGQVIWVDEAGLLSARTMARLFEVAEDADARVILSGDRRQHGSVERGSALRLLEEEAGLVPAEIREIRRQRGDYKQAVAALAEGRTSDGFAVLDRLGWVREAPDQDRYAMLAADYVTTQRQGKEALIVSPTHAEGARVTREVRAQLRKHGRLSAWEVRVPRLASLNLTEAQRRDASNYLAGDVLVFHQNAPGHVKGTRVVVGERPLPLEHAERFQAFRSEELGVAAGDLVRVTRGGRSRDGAHRLNTGTVHRVSGFTAAGDLVLANGWTLARDFGHLEHGYCVTSHASQGRTVHRVLIAQSSNSLSAASREQFYVSVSRAREGAMVYTDDKDALLAAVDRTSDRTTATELTQARGALRVAESPRDEGRPRDGLVRG